MNRRRHWYWPQCASRYLFVYRAQVRAVIAQALSQNGAKVYIIGRRKEKLDAAVAAHGQGITGELIALEGDVTDNENIKGMVKLIEEKEGYIDV